MTLDCPRLIGMLMRAQTMAWPQGFTSSVVNQLFQQKMLQKDTFKAPCCCQENVPNTALTVV